MSTGHPKSVIDEESSKVLQHIRRCIPFSIGSPIAFTYHHCIGLDRFTGSPDPSEIGASVAQGIVQAINFGAMFYTGEGRFAEVFVSIPKLKIWDASSNRFYRRPLLFLMESDHRAWSAFIDVGASAPHKVPIALLPPDSELIRNDYDLSETPGIRQL